MNPLLRMSVAAAAIFATLASVPSTAHPLGTPVTVARLTNVHGNGFTKPGQFLVRNRLEWHNTWLKVQEGRSPYEPLPAIDFDKYMILVVTRGEVTVGGHPITIESITETDDSLYVEVLRETPEYCMVSEGYTYPTDAVLIAKTAKKIRWHYRDEIVQCPGAGLP